RDGVDAGLWDEVHPVERAGELALGNFRLESRLPHRLRTAVGPGPLAVEAERHAPARIGRLGHDERIPDAAALERRERVIGLGLGLHAADEHPEAIGHLAFLRALPGIESLGLED